MTLTIREVAERLRVSQSLVRRMVRSGDIPSYRVGFGSGRLRIRADDLDAYIAGRRGEPVTIAAASPGRQVLRHVHPRVGDA